MLDSGDAAGNRIDIVLVAWRLGSGDMELTKSLSQNGGWCKGLLGEREMGG